MKNRLFILLACLFVVTSRAGITPPVLPCYAERIALQGGATERPARPPR